ncbi:uncharacterized protein BX664DRAFT_328063 [Halteromyces radiatus]|uniref:uncharacterized protein n=1 Tax=Halteromyces radiatus TaxID=101107 RepID=UPI00222000F1|nr:uncharacterized protein BX664DRAFT_328063 [Halteromyces radiatus]KAI8092758.1 hypothetical protein BX664DRAFT_328063 [Halteromyces radiatus]
MTKDPLVDEAISILDAEATRRIDEIRQSVDFICSSLRAQGKMTVSQLLKSVRSLTMDEYCNTYHGNTQYFLEEQSRKRKRIEMVTRGKKRDLFDMSDIGNSTPLSSPSSSKKKSLGTKGKTDTNIRSTISNQNDTTTVTTRTVSSSGKSACHTIGISQENDKNLNDKPDMDIVKDEKKGDKQEEEEEEVAFGPLFMQFLRPDHPKVTFQLDPQEELNPTKTFQLQVPFEFVDQFGNGHRRRIAAQIEHIQNELETFKQQLLHGT